MQSRRNSVTTNSSYKSIKCIENIYAQSQIYKYTNMQYTTYWLFSYFDFWIQSHSKQTNQESFFFVEKNQYVSNLNII